MENHSLRIGQIVPSSNTTMEIEVPAMLRAREGFYPERFSFHSSRMRMKTVSASELAAMDRESDRCAVELSDARVDVIGYACLVAIMSQGRGYHAEAECRLAAKAAEAGCPVPVVSSAGALVDTLKESGTRKIALITPYVKPLTAMVVDYIENQGIEVLDAISLEIPDNLEVGRRDPLALVDIAGRLNLSGTDAVVLSACVQMPSLAAVPLVEARAGRPVLTAAIATVRQMLRRLDLEHDVPGCGAFLRGEAK